MKMLIAFATLALAPFAHSATNVVDMAKLNLMWTDYTNRMERARIRRAHIQALHSRPPERPFRVKGGKK